MKLRIAILLSILAVGAARPRTAVAGPAEAHEHERRVREKKRKEKELKERRRREELKKRAEQKRREEEKRRHAGIKPPAPQRPTTAPPRPGVPSRPFVPPPAQAAAKPAPPAARPFASAPLPKPSPVASAETPAGPAQLPAAPKTFQNGTAITATASVQPPAAHAAFVASPAAAGIVNYQTSENAPNTYYWHNDGGTNYVHYYGGGYHWYGFYVGSSYYWSRHYYNRWWWYDPSYQRWVYFHGGYWWWQDPAGVPYVYVNGAYTPYSAAAAAYAAPVSTAAVAAPLPGAALAASTAPAASAAPAAPLFHSDVDAPAYQLTVSTDSYALVVGVESYQGLPKADFAARDATTVRDHLLRLGYPERNVILLTDSQAVRSSLEKYLETWLPKVVDAGSRVFVYFAGHGAPDPVSGDTYLMPWDGDPKFLSNTGYPVKKLYEKLGALATGDVVVVLDACFSGAGGRSVLAAGARPLVTHVDTGSGAAGKLVVFTASAGDEITGTAPDQGHGLFTYYFLKGLDGAAASGGGAVTVQDLYNYLQPSVQDAARRDNRDQSPQLIVPPDGRRKEALRGALPAKGN